MSTTKWVIDPTHSNVGFKIKHLMISTVSGEFTSFQGEVEAQGDSFTDAKITFKADASSIFTNNDQRDGHLKSPDFFDVATFPEVTFESVSFVGSGSDYSLTGNLTIKGISRPVTLAVEYAGTVTDPYGNVKAGFSLNGKISRKEFGLTWSAVTEAGSVVVSDDVKIAAEVQLVKQG